MHIGSEHFFGLKFYKSDFKLISRWVNRTPKKFEFL